MPRYRIVPIVEGDGEVLAVPILITRWLAHRAFPNFEVEINGPVNGRGRSSLTTPHDAARKRGLEYYVGIAMKRSPDAILVLLDADDDCPVELAQALRERARAHIPAQFPLEVVIAHREFETWFLAALRSMSFRQGLTGPHFQLAADAHRPIRDLERIGDAEKRIGSLVGCHYSPTVHQARLTEHLPFTPFMQRRSRSYRKLLKSLEDLTAQARRNNNDT